MQSFHINTHKLTNGIVVISIKGFLDAYTYEAVEKTLNTLFGLKQYKLIVDMSKVDYLSCAATGVLLGAIGVAQENHGNMVLLRPPPNVKEVFDLLGLTQLFSITDNMESALKRIQGTSHRDR